MYETDGKLHKYMRSYFKELGEETANFVIEPFLDFVNEAKARRNKMKHKWIEKYSLPCPDGCGETLVFYECEHCEEVRSKPEIKRGGKPYCIPNKESKGE